MNLSPIFVLLFFFYNRDDIYSFTLNEVVKTNEKLNLAQSLGLTMGLIHFIKRTVECTIIHIYSKPTKSLSKLILEMAYFMLFFGVGVSYYLFHPRYQNPIWMQMTENDNNNN